MIRIFFLRRCFSLISRSLKNFNSDGVGLMPNESQGQIKRDTGCIKLQACAFSEVSFGELCFLNGRLYCKLHNEALDAAESKTVVLLGTGATVTAINPATMVCKIGKLQTAEQMEILEQFCAVVRK